MHFGEWDKHVNVDLTYKLSEISKIMLNEKS
jgi:hypothetical protein